MDVLHERVAGLDVHQKTIVACVRRIEDGKVVRECRTFETTTAGLLTLLAWLRECRCTHVGMEATGVYWKPVWNILSDGDFELIVANAAHIKNVPGRKTDLNDAMWIADLVACGLIRASFVPDEPLQQLRSLMRTRKQFSREQTRHVQRIQKTLEEANIKLSTVISDLMGASGRRILQAMIAGVRHPGQLVQLADRRIKASRTELYEALHGRLTEHHGFLLRVHLEQYDWLAATIAQIDRQVEAALTRLDHEAAAGRVTNRDLILLCTIPGVSTLAAITGRCGSAGGQRWKFCSRIAPAPTSTRACPRESGGHGRGLRATHSGRHDQTRGADLQDDHQRTAGVVGMARRRGLHLHCDGGDRGLLEAGVAYPERRRF